MDQDKLLSVQQVCQILGRSLHIVHGYIKSGRLQNQGTEGTQKLLRLSEVLAFKRDVLPTIKAGRPKRLPLNAIMRDLFGQEDPTILVARQTPIPDPPNQEEAL